MLAVIPVYNQTDKFLASFTVLYHLTMLSVCRCELYKSAYGDGCNEELWWHLEETHSKLVIGTVAMNFRYSVFIVQRCLLAWLQQA